MGVAAGLIIDGLITINHGWRTIYYVAIALIGFITIVIILSFPETAYNRSSHPEGITTEAHHTSAAYANERPQEYDIEKEDDPHHAREIAYEETAAVRAHPVKRTWVQELRIFSGTYTEESLFWMMVRPIMLILLPPVLWATLVMSVTIGFITAVTSNVASAFGTAYGFSAWQSGLCFVSAIVGLIFGIFLGGIFSDAVADYFTKRNGGLREPEMRLPAIMISCITAPLALVLYGVGIEYNLHWICPTVGIGLRKFLPASPTSISKTPFLRLPPPKKERSTLTPTPLPSKLLNLPSNKRLPRLHNRRLPPHRRRNNRHPTRLQILLRLPPRLLHKHLGRQERVRGRLR